MHILWASEAYTCYRDISVLTVFCLIGIYGNPPSAAHDPLYPHSLPLPPFPSLDLFLGIFQVSFRWKSKWQHVATLKSRWWDRTAGTVDRNPWQRRTTSFFHLADVPVAVVVVAWPASNAILCVDFNINLTVHLQLVLVLELGLCLPPSCTSPC